MKKNEESRIVCFEGKRVILRPVHPENDLPMYLKWLNDSEVVRYIQAVPPVSLYEERDYLQKLHTKKDDVIFAIETVKSPKFIGAIGLHGINRRDMHATTGSVIGEKDCWGKGYGAEAKMLLLYHAFYNLNLRRISSSVIAFNERSQNCLLKTGYNPEGVRRDMSFREGRYWDLLEFGIFRKDFEPIWKRYQKDPETWLEHRTKRSR